MGQYLEYLHGNRSVHMRGNVGDDTLQAGSGNDAIYSGSGNDFIRGNGGNDLVIIADAANAGNDFDGGTGTDRLLLGNGYGSFTMLSQQGFENFTGGDGDDDIDWSAATSRVVMRGNSGNDILKGGSGNDLITGDPGNDELHGNNGPDTMLGEGDTNHLYPGDGADRPTSHTAGGSGFVHYSPAPMTLPCWDIRLVSSSYWLVNDLCGVGGVDIVRPADANIVTP